MKNTLKISSLFVLLIVMLIKVEAQEVSAHKAYKIEVKNSHKSDSKIEVLKSTQGNSLAWSDVAQGEELYFTIRIKSKKENVDNLIIKTDDFITEGHMGSISKSFFRFSEKEMLFPNWDPSVAVSLKKGESKILYCLIKIPKYISPTIYRGTLCLKSDDSTLSAIPITIAVSMNYKKHEVRKAITD